MKLYQGVRSNAAIDWSTWQAVELATLCFVIRGGQVLLIRKKRGLGAGKINGPGGKIDPGESPRECAVRETHEELGITPLELSHAGQHLFQFTDGYSIRVFVYRAEGYEGEARETDEAVPLWTNLDAVPYDEMWEDDTLWLPLLFDRRSFLGRYVFEEDRMLDVELREVERSKLDDDLRR